MTYLFQAERYSLLVLEDSYQKEVADEWGPANAVTAFQIRAFLNMAKVGKNDVLYDLGSGHGRVVRMAVTYAKVKKAIGIEHIPERFCYARSAARRMLTKGQLAKVDFWFQELDELTASSMVGATVAYYGLDAHRGEARMLRRLFGKRRVRIIRKDLPIVGYAPIAVSRDSSTTWFFLMSFPIERYRVGNMDDWAKSILGPKATIGEIFKYYDRQLKKRQLLDRVESVRELKKLVRNSFKN